MNQPMSAIEKNLQALVTLFGNAALAHRINLTRIGVFSDNTSYTTSGILLADALGEALGRLWLNIDACGPLSNQILRSAQKASASGSKPIALSEGWSPPYDAVIFLGGVPSGNPGPCFQIGADGWVLTSGAASRFGDSPVPVAPAAAGAIASAEVFKIVFAHELGGRAHHLTQSELNLWNFGRSAHVEPPKDIVLGRAHFFGVGAVTHGLLWILERWPGVVTGSPRLIDPDRYEPSNGQRYAGMEAGFVEEAKAIVKASLLHARHPGLIAEGFEIDGDAYFDEHEPEPNVSLAISGLDSKEMRRHVALKLPLHAVNMWTEGCWVGASRFGGAGWPCLMCVYPEGMNAQLDDTTRLHRATGLSPFRVRALVDGSNRLTEADAAIVAQHCHLSAGLVMGRSIWSVVQDLCATGTIKISGQSKNADVPFAYSSLLAGVAGFISMLQTVSEFNVAPYDWSYDVLDRPHANLARGTAPNPTCMLCAT